jgi:hypothetical protein
MDKLHARFRNRFVVNPENQYNIEIIL